MITQFTGGDICYGQPVNYFGLVLVIIIGRFLWDLIKWTWRKR